MDLEGLIERGDRDAALGWIDDSGLNHKQKRALVDFVHRFPQVEFYRELPEGLDRVERRIGSRLPNLYKRLRGALAFLEPGQLDAVRFDGQSARRAVLREQDAWFSFDLLGLPYHEQPLPKTPNALLPLAVNQAPNHERLCMWRKRRDRKVQLLYPRGEGLPGSERSAYQDPIQMLRRVDALRLRDGRQIHRLPDRPIALRLDWRVTIELADGRTLDLPCREYASELVLTPGARLRGAIDVQAELFEDWADERFGSFDVSGRLRDDLLQARLYSSIFRRREPPLEFEAQRGEDGHFVAQIDQRLRLNRAEGQIHIEGQIELWPEPQENDQLSRSDRPRARLLEHARMLGAELRERPQALAQLSDAQRELVPAPLALLLGGLRWPQAARYGNFALTVPDVDRLRWLEPSEIFALEPGSRHAMTQGARPFLVIAKQRKPARLLLLALDGRSPDDPYLYLVDDRAQARDKLGEGTRFGDFLRSLFIAEQLPGSA